MPVGEIYYNSIIMAKRLKRTADGSVDLRTKAGKAIAARMAKARASRGSLKNRIKRLFK